MGEYRRCACGRRIRENNRTGLCWSCGRDREYRRRSQARRPCLDCGRPLWPGNRSGWCEVCRRRGHQCKVCGVVSATVRDALCEPCRRALSVTVYPRECDRPPPHLLEPLLRLYESRAARRLPLFDFVGPEANGAILGVV